VAKTSSGRIVPSRVERRKRWVRIVVPEGREPLVLLGDERHEPRLTPCAGITRIRWVRV
jgi:hypothetical protein